MLRWAVARGDLDHNPIDGMKGPSISKPRSRTLSDAEMRQLWNGLSEASQGHAKVLKLCLATGQRLGEVCGLRPSELDLEKKVWNIPASRTRNGHPHSVPLTDLALRLIAGADPMDGVLPSRSQVSNWVLDHQFGLSHFTAHDLRRTVLTKMAELGVAPIVLGHVANHRTTTKAGMTLSVYVHHQYEKEKREALECGPPGYRALSQVAQRLFR
jgi:integrase